MSASPRHPPNRLVYGHRPTLTAEEVYEIRAWVDEGWTHPYGNARALARLYHVSPNTIFTIGRRETWGWLPERACPKAIRTPNRQRLLGTEPRRRPRKEANCAT